MKLLHLSDLHIGRRLYEYSLLEDQKYLLNQILNLVDDERPQAVLIAGDVYDKSVPSAEAVSLFDDFLVRLAGKNTEIFIISGNHDSPERLAFGGRLMESRGVHVSPVYSGAIAPITLDGKFDFYLLPFVRPGNVRAVHPDAKIESYTDAVRTAIEAMPVNEGHVRILLSHQFVTGAVRSDSEESYVGDMGNVDSDVFGGFDYVALGHIHSAQNMKSPHVRYCGTPMAYSLSEIECEKSATIVNLSGEGDLQIRTIPLKPLHNIRKIRGAYNDVTNREYYETVQRDDYIQVILTDETDIPDAHGSLHRIYPNLLCIAYDNNRTRRNQIVGVSDGIEEKSPMQLFEELFEKQNNQPLNERQKQIVTELMEEVEREAQA